jgi:hypothetical protein
VEITQLIFVSSHTFWLPESLKNFNEAKNPFSRG